MENIKTTEEAQEKDATLEQMFSELENIIEKMENPEVTLEQSFDLYNKGVELLKKCNKTIDTVEKKVLLLDEDGETHEF